MSRAASLPGAELFPGNRLFLKKPLVPGSFAAWGRTFSRKSTFFEEATCPGQLRCLGQNLFSKKGLSRIQTLLCAEQDVGNPKQWTFRNSGTPARRTRRRESQKMHFQELWDSCAQNKTSKISKKCTFWHSGTPVRRIERRK